jgi:hypothetical protein
LLSWFGIFAFPGNMLTWQCGSPNFYSVIWQGSGFFDHDN